MQAGSILQTLLKFGKELPTLLGQAWPNVVPQFNELVIRFQKTTDPSERDSLVMDLIMMFSRNELVFSRLQPIIAEFRQERRMSSQPREKVDTSQESEQLRKLAEELRQSQPQDFEPAGESSKYSQVEPEMGTELILLHLKGFNVGTKRAPRIVVMTKETLSEGQFQKVVADLGLDEFYIPPIDLSLQVEAQPSSSGIMLTYSLNSPVGIAGYHNQKIQQTIPTFASVETYYEERLMRKIEALGQGCDVTGLPLTAEQAEEDLKGLGRELYKELFPPELMNAYREFRDKVRTMQITSNEPWIPWELIRPYDARNKNDIIDDDFLCMRFQLTRWLAGPLGAAPRIQVSRLVCVEPNQSLGQPTLRYATDEHKCLVDLAVQHNIEDLSPSLSTHPAVLALLKRGGIGMWHFATHGNVNRHQATESEIMLADGSPLRASHIHGPIEAQISNDRPLIFLNACRVGQQGWSLTRLSGWAAVLVGTCRCGAFIGPAWSVNDWLAYEFAKTLYDALRKQKTIGEATQAARQRVRDIAPNDPTAVAYSVYAHPNARVVFGTGRVPPLCGGAVPPGNG